MCAFERVNTCARVHACVHMYGVSGMLVVE